jgi:hypothetical protein
MEPLRGVAVVFAVIEKETEPEPEPEPEVTLMKEGLFEVAVQLQPDEAET